MHPISEALRRQQEALAQGPSHSLSISDLVASNRPRFELWSAGVVDVVGDVIFTWGGILHETDDIIWLLFFFKSGKLILYILYVMI